ncbi:MAG: hypothetical protein WC473_04960 [Patescibacteria group bacterium]|jgi:Tfp pilus assembly protein PilV
MPKSLSLNKSGISILEAILAIAVLAMAILGIIQIFPLALKMSRIAEQTTVAANLAQAQAETIYSLDYNGINTGIIEARHRLASDPANPFYKYERQTTVNYVDGNLNNSAIDVGLKKISITIYWLSPYLGKEITFPLIFLISEK